MDQFYSNNEFDISKFNSIFEEQQESNKKKESKELDNMKKVIEKEQLHEMSFGKIFVNMKDHVFSIIYEILTLNFNSMEEFKEIFTKDNRLFYIGLFILIICLILYIISFLFFTQKEQESNLNINANLKVPNDYKFSYYPYNKQNATEITETRKLNNTLKKRLLNSNRKISSLQGEIAQLNNQLNNMPYEIDDQEVSSDIIPKEIKDQIKNQVKKDLLNAKIN